MHVHWKFFVGPNSDLKFWERALPRQEDVRRYKEAWEAQHSGARRVNFSNVTLPANRADSTVTFIDTSFPFQAGNESGLEIDRYFVFLSC